MLVSIFFLLSGAFSANKPYQKVIEEMYPQCSLKKESVFIDKNERELIEQKTGYKLHSRLSLRYRGLCNNKKITLYVDSHIVRTLNETLVIEVTEDAKINQIKVASFMEPQEYIPPKKWIDQFNKKTLASEMRVRKDIDGLSGATLSANAIAKAAKRILAIHEIKK